MLAGVLGKAVAVTQGLLGIAVGTIRAVKKVLAELANSAIDPIARQTVEQERQRDEDRQKEIDDEKLDLFHKAKRDGRWSRSLRDRYQELHRQSEEITKKLGPRKAVEAGLVAAHSP